MLLAAWPLPGTPCPPPVSHHQCSVGCMCVRSVTAVVSVSLTTSAGVGCSVTAVRLCVTLWTAAHQAPLSMGLSRQEHWSGLSFPPLGDLPDPWIQAMSLICSALAGGFFTTEPVRVSFFVCRQRDLFMNPLLACVTSQNLLGCPAALSAPGLSAGGGLAPMIPCQGRRRARLPGGLALPQTPSPNTGPPA